MELTHIQRRWIERLKSGDKVKWKKLLREPNGGPGRCCLGVARDLMALDVVCREGDVILLGKEAKRLGLRSGDGEFSEVVLIETCSGPWKCRTLAELNDETEMTHVEIGEWIDKNRRLVFVNPSAETNDEPGRTD
jgi:hypothetical protein